MRWLLRSGSAQKKLLAGGGCYGPDLPLRQTDNVTQVLQSSPYQKLVLYFRNNIRKSIKVGMGFPAVGSRH